MSKIKIYSRIRLHPESTIKKKSYKVTLRESNIQLFQEKVNVMNDKIYSKKGFTFDKVFDIDYNNEDIYHEIGHQLIENIQAKQNSIFYVYGQTGSGKTYTLLGNESNDGIVQLLINELVVISDNITFSGIQIYRNKCYDIFNSNAAVKECELKDGSVKFMNLTSHQLLLKNRSNIIERINKARHVGVSSSNDSSSRSHLIFQINIGNYYIKLVDLAGSERASRSKYNENHNMRENADINLSILALKECIRNINKSKIPYRNSKVTKILKPTFSNTVCTYILSTISPLKKDIQDSINTLKYMSDFKKFKRHHDKKLPPLYLNKRDAINKLNVNINYELNKKELERTKLLGLIENNIESLKDLKINIIDS